MKKTFITPNVEVLLIENRDIVTLSESENNDMNLDLTN